MTQSLVKGCSSTLCGKSGEVGRASSSLEELGFREVAEPSVPLSGFQPQPQPLPCLLCVHSTLRAMVRSERGWADTLAAVDASSFPFEGPDAAADEATSSIKPNTLVAAAKPRKPPSAVFVMGLTVHGGG